MGDNSAGKCTICLITYTDKWNKRRAGTKFYKDKIFWKEE